MSDGPPDSSQPDVLIADDQPDVLDALRMLLQPEGIRTETVRSPSDVLEALGRRQFDVLLMDLNYARDTTSGREGLDLLSEVRAIDSHLPIIVMTGWGTMDIAIEALRHGVRDFVQKPWDNDKVLAAVRTMADHRKAERHAATRSARELAEARDIQRRLLPATLPDLPGWAIAAACEEAASVGGDTYDVIAIDHRHLAISIGDVAGKGIPAALLAANLQAAVRSAVADGHGPAELCGHVNRTLAATLPDDRFVTFFFSLLDTHDGTLRYCNAGHNPPLLVRRDGSRATLSGGGMVLGVDPGLRYDEHKVAIGPGDVLVLYTDGVTEALDDAGDEFGEARLAGCLAAERDRGAAAVCDRLLASLRAFSGDRREDDQTLVVVCRNDAPAD
jgi:phosphoserine phosphatase RsbU/P